MIYDTIYGYQDRNDDAKIGVKSMSILLGDTPQISFSIISAGMGLGLVSAGYIADLTLPYYIGISGVMTHIQWQIWTADVINKTNLWEHFSSNKYIGGAITASIIAGHF